MFRKLEQGTAQQLTDRGSLVETQTCVHLCGYTTWNNFENLASKFDEKTVEGGIRLRFDIATSGLAVLNGYIDEFLVCWLVCGCQDKRLGPILLIRDPSTTGLKSLTGFVVASWGLYTEMAMR